ncbi:MAG: DinB family protein [Candidatus Acidiferrales bacterium]
MNYYGGKDLARSFRTVRKNTITIAQEIPADKYSFRATPDTRTVGEMLTHIALGYGFQYQVHAQERRTTLEGFDFPALVKRFAAEEQKPRTKNEVIELLRVNGEKWAVWLEGVSDDFLAERVQMHPGMEPPSKSRFETVMSVKEHEMHHRAQLMLIERMIGVVPHLTREMQARFAAAAAAQK